MPSPHPGDALTPRRRVAYIVLLGALTALGPFTVDRPLGQAARPARGTALRLAPIPGPGRGG